MSAPSKYVSTLRSMMSGQSMKDSQSLKDSQPTGEHPGKWLPYAAFYASNTDETTIHNDFSASRGETRFAAQQLEVALLQAELQCKMPVKSKPKHWKTDWFAKNANASSTTFARS